MIKFEHSVFALPVRAGRRAARRARRWRPAHRGANPLDRRRHGRRPLRGHDHEPHRRHRIRPPQSAHRESRAPRRTTFRSGSPGFSRSWPRRCSSSPLGASIRSHSNFRPLALAILFLYSYTKRFTAWSHFVLGFCLGISPAAAWIAIRGSLDPRMLILCAAVTLWVGGFDVLYACQDVDFDRVAGLHSIPKKFGVARALPNRPRDASGDGRAARLARHHFHLAWPAWAGLPSSRCCSATNIRS